jgi:hypothetical protein
VNKSGEAVFLIVQFMIVGKYMPDRLSVDRKKEIVS